MIYQTPAGGYQEGRFHIEVPRIRIILPPASEKNKRGSPSWEEDMLIPISREQRLFWPPFRIDFYLQTDLETILTHVVGASAREGDLLAGYYITKGLRPWFRNHPELRVGSVLEAIRLDVLRYSLSVLEV